MGFVYFSYTITEVYSFLLLIPFGRFFCTFGPVFAGFLWSTGHPLIGTNYCAGLVGKDIDKFVSWRDFARVGKAMPLIYDEFDGEIAKDDNARSSKSNVGKYRKMS